MPAPQPCPAPPRGALAQAAAVLSDLDGCLISGARVLPGAAEFVREVGDRLWIVSNNSTDSPDSLSARLAGHGLSVAPERCILAGAEAVRGLAAQARPCALLGDAPLRSLARALGLPLTQAAPEVVLLCRDTGFDYARLQRLIGWLEAGAELLVANPDTSHPGPDGVPVPETGALLAAVLAVRPRQPHRILGKPAPDLLRIALARAGVTPAEAMMIGDTPLTDAGGAAAAGVPFVLVAPNAGLAHLTAPGAAHRGAAC